MNYKKPFRFLKDLQLKLNLFYQKKSKSGIIIKNKSRSNKTFNPVTNFDKAIEKFIRNLISKKFPTHSISGEEFDDKKISHDFKWYIDPIDGTKAFVLGLPTWSNLIGINLKNRSILGLANFPDLNRFYINDKRKSYLFKNKKKQILKSSSTTNLKKIKIIGNFHSSLSIANQKKLNKKLGWSIRFASYDALSYCLLSEGKIDAVIEANLKPYDIKPLIPIIENSGAIITNWKNGTAEFGGNILATSNRKLHNKIIKLLKK